MHRRLIALSFLAAHQTLLSMDILRYGPDATFQGRAMSDRTGTGSLDSAPGLSTCADESLGEDGLGTLSPSACRRHVVSPPASPDEQAPIALANRLGTKMLSAIVTTLSQLAKEHRIQPPKTMHKSSVGFWIVAIAGSIKASSILDDDPLLDDPRLSTPSDLIQRMPREVTSETLESALETIEDAITKGYLVLTPQEHIDLLSAQANYL